MSILKDKISKNKKKIMIATGAAVVAVAITIGGAFACDAIQDTKANKSYTIVSQIEQEDFKENTVTSENFTSLLNRFGLNVTPNTQSLSSDMEKLYQIYSLVWNAEYNDVDCQEQIEERISEFQKILTNLAELRVPGKIKNISNNKIEATGAAETKQKDISVYAYNRNWAYTSVVFDESKGVYIWTYTIEPNFIMSCEDQDLLFLLKATKEDAKFFTNENILKAISAYIRVLGNEYQFIYDKTKEGTVNEWLEQQKVTYEGTIINVTKTNAKSKEELLSQLTKFKKHLLEKYEKEGINPEDCKVSKVEEKWCLIISTTNEKIELNENYSIICEKIASIQSILISIDAQDYTESVVSKENSTLMNHNISEVVDDIAKSYVYLK